MHRLIVFSLFALAGCAGASSSRTSDTVAPVPDKEALAFWADRVNQVRVGMRREEVERLLPLPLTGYTEGTTFTGSAQGVQYFVAPGFKITIFYDYTGGTHGKSPENIVVQAPVLTFDPLDPVGPKN